jgi:hypothetical protein
MKEVVNIKERISMMKMEYYVCKEEMREDDCRWSGHTLNNI